VVNRVSATIGGREAVVQSAVLVGSMAAVYQVTIVVPTGLPNVETTSLVISTAGQDSPTVTFALRQQD
jgi:uncharacterized protein (TIGR03437 family)